MTIFKSRPRGASGYTMIELLIVVTIIAILASIVTPHFDILLQKSYQATSKGNLGMLRSTLSIYYSDMEGRYPLAGYPDGPADTYGVSLTDSLAPKYINALPAPKLRERIGSFNGFAMIYDTFAGACLTTTPPKDVYILAGPAGSTIGYDRPWMYDPNTGLIYICNSNDDVAGNPFYFW